MLTTGYTRTLRAGDPNRYMATKGKNMRHPIQPLEKDNDGVLRFKQNAIVRYLLDAGPFDMNHLALMPFSQADQEQFAQLIGYSLCGFGDLSYVSAETYNLAESQSEAI